MQENVKKCTHFASASGGLRPPYSLPGLCPGSYWGTSVPQTHWPRPHLIVKSWVRLCPILLNETFKVYELLI